MLARDSASFSNLGSSAWLNPTTFGWPFKPLGSQPLVVTAGLLTQPFNRLRESDVKLAHVGREDCDAQGVSVAG